MLPTMLPLPQRTVYNIRRALARGRLPVGGYPPVTHSCGHSVKYTIDMSDIAHLPCQPCQMAAAQDRAIQKRQGRQPPGTHGPGRKENPPDKPARSDPCPEYARS